MSDKLTIRIRPDTLEGATDLMLRVSPEIGPELLDALQSAGFEASQAAEFSGGVTEFLIHVGEAVATYGGLAGIAGVITAVVHRNDGRSVTIEEADGRKVSATGLPEKTVREMLERTFSHDDNSKPSNEEGGGQTPSE